jgi:acyl carrier protein
MGSEVWPALLSGAALYIAPAEVRVDRQLLQRWLIGQRISIAFTTTVIAEQLLGLPWPKADVALRVLRFGGERFRGRPANRVYPFRIYNEYGPTEDTVWTTVAEVVDDDASAANIGQPIENHRVYVLDKNLNRVPRGEVGELCIGGVGLARGYLNQPELTAEKFISSPFSESGTERLYRTGDLVRCRPEGNIEFWGRVDNQFKIRGHRVEAGEIEVALTQHPSVCQCVVIARENRLGDMRIVAYVVAGREPDEVVSESLVDRQIAEWKQALPSDLSRRLAPKLRSYLSNKLPDFMVPSGFVFLDRLPLTSNGKIDRCALPPPARLSNNRFVELQTPLQRKLAEIWQKVLDVESVGETDDFFELGGDSLSATRIVLEIERVLGRRIPRATLLQAPTIEKLAATFQAQDWKPTRSPLVAVQPLGSRPPFFAVHTLSGRVMFYRELAQRSERINHSMASSRKVWMAA